jgi:phosphoserine aminotransferase
MGIFSKVAAKEVKHQQVEEPIQNDEVQKETKKQKVEGVDLTIEEFEYLFNLIKNSTFKGTELEIVYSIILKLQKRYLEKKQ